MYHFIKGKKVYSNNQKGHPMWVFIIMGLVSIGVLMWIIRCVIKRRKSIEKNN
jgi:heme/copper-type cytochrome/quinol oxidase subunit 2